jgi:transmembrane sensor
VRVDPGQQLSYDAGAGRYVLSAIAIERVGEWRQGRLTFENASLERVAADLTRASGIRFSVLTPGEDGASPASVSGSVLIDPIRKDPRSVGALLGLDVTRSDQGWSIASP